MGHHHKASSHHLNLVGKGTRIHCLKKDQGLYQEQTLRHISLYADPVRKDLDSSSIGDVESTDENANSSHMSDPRGTHLEHSGHRISRAVWGRIHLVSVCTQS